MSPLNQSRQPTPGDRFTVLPTPLARGGCVVSGSLSMRRVIKNICAATAITVLLLVVWVVLMKNDGTNHLAFGLSPNDARRPLSSFNVFVTNCTPWQISLYQAELSLAHAGGKATTSDAEFWNGKDMVPVIFCQKKWQVSRCRLRPMSKDSVSASNIVGMLAGSERLRAALCIL